MNPEPADVKLQKFIADHGLCSRRKAEAWIARGLVTVNDRAAVIGMRVRPGSDRVAIRGRPLRGGRRSPRILIMHKPPGYICSNHDPHYSRTIFDLVPPPLRKERLFCAGRLDKASEGLIIVTNDGQLSQRLTHPRHHILKKYRVLLNKPFNPCHWRLLVRGMEIDGEHLKVEKVIPTEKGPDSERRLQIHLRHGRKREIRRLLEALGYRVTRLRRFQIGRLNLRGLAPGGVRELTNDEVNLLIDPSA